MKMTRRWFGEPAFVVASLLFAVETTVVFRLRRHAEEAADRVFENDVEPFRFGEIVEPTGPLRIDGSACRIHRLREVLGLEFRPDTESDGVHQVAEGV